MKPSSAKTLWILMIVAALLIGMRLGKKIERIDLTDELAKKDREIATVQDNYKNKNALEFRTFFSSLCRIQFLYPAIFKEQEDATEEARLTSPLDKRIISVNCNRSRLTPFIEQTQTQKPQEIKTVQDVAISVYKSDIKDSVYLFYTHPHNKLFTLIRMPKNLIPLFEETVQFIDEKSL